MAIGHWAYEIKFGFYPFDGSIPFSVHWYQWKKYSTNTCIGFGSCHSINGMPTVHFTMNSFIYIHMHYARILLLYLFLGRIQCSDHIIYSLNLTISIANRLPYFMYQYMYMEYETSFHIIVCSNLFQIHSIVPLWPFVFTLLQSHWRIEYLF